MDAPDNSVLVLDDDKDLVKLISDYLSREGFKVLGTLNIAAARKALQAELFTIAIVDLMLPDGDGLSFVRDFRKGGLNSDIPILILSARGDDVDRIVGLEVGADDYMAKPFNPRELLARIRAIIRKRATANSGPTESDDTITRSIEFAPEHRQAGMAILSYFSRVLSEKYPSVNAAVSIEQAGALVRMKIRAESGSTDIIEQALETYGRVVIGELPPSALSISPLAMAQLENKLELARLEIQQNERLLALQTDTIRSLNRQLENITSIHQRGQDVLTALTKKLGSSGEVRAAVKLIEKYMDRTVLTKEEHDEVERSVRIVYKQEPTLIDDIKNFLMGVASSATATAIQNTLRVLGV